MSFLDPDYDNDHAFLFVSTVIMVILVIAYTYGGYTSVQVLP